MPVLTNLWKVKMENCSDSKSGTARRSSLSLVMTQAKAKEEGRVKLTECSRCGRIGHIRAECRAKTNINGGPPELCAQTKSVGNCEDEEVETSQNVPLETIDWVLFRVLSDHDDDAGSDESTFETTEMMPPLSLDSWFKRTETLITETRRIHSSTDGMGSKNSSTLCSKWILGLSLSELPCLFSESEVGCVPTFANLKLFRMTSPVRRST